MLDTKLELRANPGAYNADPEKANGEIILAFWLEEKTIMIRKLWPTPYMAFSILEKVLR